MAIKDGKVVVVRITALLFHSAFYVAAFLSSLLVNFVQGLEEFRDFDKIVLLLKHQLLHQLHQYRLVVLSVDE